MNYPDILWLIARIVLFLACVAGMLLAVILVVRGRLWCGLLALLGFGLLAVGPLFVIGVNNLGLIRVLSAQALRIVALLINGVAPTVGVLALGAALLLAARPAGRASPVTRPPKTT